MKHAYLIIAHHEFEVLSRLVKALDDERNDIYVHIDKKAESQPVINSDYSSLYFLKDRIDIRWGDVSQVAAELALFEAAATGGDYSYYHLLSGVDMPVKSQDFIHAFFSRHSGKEFIGFCRDCSGREIDRKVRRYHLYPRDFKNDPGLAGTCRRILRALFLRLQELPGIRRHPRTVFMKGSNWVSVTADFVRFLLREKDEIMSMYRNSFCADEIFLQTLCWNSGFRGRLYNKESDALGCMRSIKWEANRVTTWHANEIEGLMHSHALFARKFSAGNLDVVDGILNKLRRDVEKVQ